VVLVERRPFRRYFEGSVWGIPVELVLPLTTKEYAGVTVRVPADVESYLEMRYGDWRSPRPEWSFWLHDGLITSRSPRELVELLARDSRRLG